MSAFLPDGELLSLLFAPVADLAFSGANIGKFLAKKINNEKECSTNDE
jgi:hypothetical protein